MATPLHPPSASNIPACLADLPDFHVQGYPKLAYCFSQCPSYLHLRRFSSLAVRALLYRQNKLIVLENRILQLEGKNRLSNERDRQVLQEDFGYLTDAGPQEPQEAKDLRRLHEEMNRELKEYEDGLIRFDTLGRKSRNAPKLAHVQRWLNQPEGCNKRLVGVDALLWGDIRHPDAHAIDIIQVLDEPKMSVIGEFLQQHFLTWAHRLPLWLQYTLIWSKKGPDVFEQHSRSAGWFENVALAIGNVTTSLIIYGSVTSLYFTSGRAANAVSAVVVASVVTICTILFKNQQFVIMLTAVCAVLVTLLTNDESKPGQGMIQTGTS